MSRTLISAERVIVEPLDRSGTERGWVSSAWVAIPAFLNTEASA